METGGRLVDSLASQGYGGRYDRVDLASDFKPMRKNSYLSQ